MSKLPGGIYVRIWTNNQTYLDMTKEEWNNAISNMWNPIFHRTTGPAVEYYDDLESWYVNGEYIDRKIINYWFKNHKWNKSDGLDTEEKLLCFKLKFL